MRPKPTGYLTSGRPLRAALALGALVGITGIALTGCNSTSSPDAGTNTPGSVVQNPDTGLYLIVDASAGGLGNELRITRQAWGRLLDVYGLDALGSRVLMNKDFLIDPSLVTDGVNYLLETSPVTSQQILVILRDIQDTTQGGGRDQFYAHLKSAEAGLKPIDDAGMFGGALYTMLPRNAALMIQFDDLLDPTSLDGTTLRMLTGTPSVIPFEARVVVDPNHGDLSNHDGVAGLEFYSTRILIDMTVSEVESFETNPPLPVNAIGLPASVDVNLSNAQFRIPTRTDLNVGQDHLLTNPTGHSVTTNSNGSVDFSSSTWDVVRSIRSGGATAQTGDPDNGFLPDSLTPVVVGEQFANIASVPVNLNPPPAGDGTMFLIPTFVFQSSFCAQTPMVGDIITQDGGLFAEVIEQAAPQAGGTASNIKVHLLAWPPVWDSPGLSGPLEWINSAVGPAQFLSPFDPIADAGREMCFVRVFPSAPDINAPATDVSTSAMFSVRFSEPMDPVTVTAFDALTLTRESIPTASHEYVVGLVSFSQDVQEFSFLPDLPLAHAVAGAEDYFLTVGTGAMGPTDLAGNALSSALPQVTITIDPTAGPQQNGGRVSRFSSMDEEAPQGNAANGPIPEWAGQISFNFNAVQGQGRETISPRSVTRFQGFADRQNLMIAAMTSTAILPNLVQSPLSNLGSKTQFVWRFLDLGFDLYDIYLQQGKPMANQYFSNYNIDVEGLNWSPMGGQVLVDNFPGFEIRLSHAYVAPDEYIIPPPVNLPAFPLSGLVDIFDNNLLDSINDPQTIVHPKVAGYTLNPGDMYISGTGTNLMPFPLNQGGDPSQFRYYTYRDTTLQTRAGPQCWGVYPVQWHSLKGISLPYIGCTGTPPPPAPTPYPYYSQDNIQSIALPLLLEFRCWQSAGATAINRLDTSQTSNVSTKPYFRAFSTGGINASNETVVIDPSIETRANGGFNPGSLPSGQPMFGLDNEVYIGAVDFVVRVSRAVSIWFPATDPDDPTGAPFLADFSQYVLEPPLQSQPVGTNIQASFRGASNVVAASLPLTDAFELDLYGDHYIEQITDCFPDTTTYPAITHDANPLAVNTDIAFYNSDTRWFSDPSLIDGASYYQVRLSFISNTQTGLSPELSAFALTWSQ